MSEGAAGFDLYAALPDGQKQITIEPHETVRIPTGVALQLPMGCMGLILVRSSWSDYLDTKHPPVDPDYRGEVHILLSNTSNSPQVVSDGARVAQLVLVPILTPVAVGVPTLDPTERGDGGFGSTGQD